METEMNLALELSTVVRMVVPLRREFGRELDVHAFLRDADYAREVLEQAATSQVERLRGYAQSVGRQLQATVASPPIARPPINQAAQFQEIQQKRKEAAKRLIDLVGPAGEPLAIRIERAAHMHELSTLVASAHALVGRMRGNSAANAYLVVVGLTPSR